MPRVTSQDPHDVVTVESKITAKPKHRKQSRKSVELKTQECNSYRNWIARKVYSPIRRNPTSVCKMPYLPIGSHSCDSLTMISRRHTAATLLGWCWMIVIADRHQAKSLLRAQIQAHCERAAITEPEVRNFSLRFLVERLQPVIAGCHGDGYDLELK